MPFFQTALLLFAVCAVAVADIFLKRAYAVGVFAKTLTNPWIIAAIILYLLQILIFAYLFSTGAKLWYVGIMQVIFYEIIILIASVVFFKEGITMVQAIGAGFAIAGVILLNL